jgi:hypothetical protein
MTDIRFKNYVDAIYFTRLLVTSDQCNGCDGHTRVYADGVSGRKLAILPVARHHYLREESHHRATQEEMCNGLPTTGDFLTLNN